MRGIVTSLDRGWAPDSANYSPCSGSFPGLNSIVYPQLPHIMCTTAEPSLNLSNFNSRRVEVWRFDNDGDDTAGSLVISLHETGRHAVVVFNQFEADDYQDANFDGRIEQGRFRNKTVSPKASSIPVQEPNALLSDAFSKVSADLPGSALLP